MPIKDTADRDKRGEMVSKITKETKKESKKERPRGCLVWSSKKASGKLATAAFMLDFRDIACDHSTNHLLRVQA